MRKGCGRPLVALAIVVAGLAGACGPEEPATPNPTPSIDLSNVSETEGRFAAHRSNQNENRENEKHDEKNREPADKY